MTLNELINPEPTHEELQLAGILGADEGWDEEQEKDLAMCFAKHRVKFGLQGYQIALKEMKEEQEKFVKGFNYNKLHSAYDLNEMHKLTKRHRR